MLPLSLSLSIVQNGVVEHFVPLALLLVHVICSFGRAYRRGKKPLVHKLRATSIFARVGVNFHTGADDSGAERCCLRRRDGEPATRAPNAGLELRLRPSEVRKLARSLGTSTSVRGTSWVRVLYTRKQRPRHARARGCIRGPPRRRRGAAQQAYRVDLLDSEESPTIRVAEGCTP